MSSARSSRSLCMCNRALGIASGPPTIQFIHCHAQGKPLPNGTVADSHAEIGVIQQAYAGKTQGAEMSMTVSGKDVCGYCKGDIAAAANAAGLKSLTVQAVDNATGLPKTYYWLPGMKSIKEKP